MKKTSANHELTKSGEAPADAAVLAERSAPEKGGAEKKHEDVVLLAGPTADQRGVMVLRKRDDRVELGEVRPVEQGKSLAGDLVKLVPRAGQPRICDVETTFSAEERIALAGKAERGADRMVARRAHHGPPQVATQRYRDNWSTIYERRGPVDPADLN